MSESIVDYPQNYGILHSTFDKCTHLKANSSWGVSDWHEDSCQIWVSIGRMMYPYVHSRGAFRLTVAGRVKAEPHGNARWNPVDCTGSAT